MASDPTRIGAALVQRLGNRYRSADRDALTGLLQTYYRYAGAEDLAERSLDDLYGAALSHWRAGHRRGPGERIVRAFTPVIDEDGWQTPHSVVDVVVDDQPFLVDTVLMAIEAENRAVHFLAHPVVEVWRDATGHITAVDGHGDTTTIRGTEAFIHVELDRASDPASLARLEARIARGLRDAAVAVADWDAMRAVMQALVDELSTPMTGVDENDRAETSAFLRWLLTDRFVFLGFREYELVGDAEDEVEIVSVDGSGLGIQRDAAPSRRRVDELSAVGATLVHEPRLLNLTKANSVATVHRPARLDYVGVKRIVDGAVVGERRFLGLYTARAYLDPVHDVPVIRTKASRAAALVGHLESAHDRAAVEAILAAYPRDELFQIDVDDLTRIVEAILHLRDRRRVRLLVHPDRFGRFMSCLVYVPRDRYSTAVRQRIQELLVDAFRGTSCSFDSQVSGSVLARLHIHVFTGTTAIPDVDIGALEAAIEAITRDWADVLREALVEGHGEDEGLALFERYGSAFPSSYTEDHRPAVAIADIARLEALDGDQFAVNLYRPLEAAEREWRLKVFEAGTPIALTDVVPMLDAFGITVMDERPYEIRVAGAAPSWIYDFGLVLPEAAPSLEDAGVAFEEALTAVWQGRAESDGFNELVLTASLSWRDVVVLRAYRRYLRQIGSTFSQEYYEETLAAHTDIVSLIVRRFRARFDPDHAGDRWVELTRLAQDIADAIDRVPSLDEDRMLRSFAAVVDATVRTNHFQRDPDGRPAPELALKLDPSRVPGMPRPRPAHEIFVYSPRVEGVHLRAGPVARGGLRWSDRREDFRTEVLGLMKAQNVKNAVIVPVGAKGGFVCKQLPPGDDAEVLRAAVVERYQGFVSALLDVTDNLVDGAVIRPSRAIAHDGDDPYLVVAADKGTATFSDIANEIALRRGFWLGDAFASGGSAGYDHKAMGITARGAWESVKRHFRELGLDVQARSVTVAGIGDMSGDVFGNGMLLSPRLRLVAAFDHRHVFLDPDPDPERSHAERRRLFDLPRSSWADYDRSLISEGGGVFERGSKAVEVSQNAAEVLGIEGAGSLTLTPDQLIRAILAAPVDLLWNGGIGTYVRASTESDADVGDRSNDAVRISATDVRCAVVGEGGNLGLTQRARVELARRGVKVYSDAIDNSAGVNCSDHEVNIKILLDRLVGSGDLTLKQRDELLGAMTEEVAELVLVENYRQTQAISAGAAQAAGMVEVHQRHLAWLERVVGLDRELEALPSDEELLERRAAGEGLTAPELAIVLAYTKLALAQELLASDLPEDPAHRAELSEYFPRPIRASYGDRLDEHPLRRELVVCMVTNRLVDRAGISMAHRLAEETSVPLAAIARAHRAAWTIFDLEAGWDAVDALDNQIPAAAQQDMHLEAKRLGERATRWILRNEALPLDVDRLVARHAPQVAELALVLPGLLTGDDLGAFERRTAELREADVPLPLAQRAALQPLLIAALDVGRMTLRTGRTLERTAATYFALNELLELAWLRNRIVALPRTDRWESLARSALRDDFYSVHAELTGQVLAASAASSPEVAVDAWCAPRRDAVAHCLSVLADIRGTGRADLSQLSVALREFRNLLHVAAGGPDAP